MIKKIIVSACLLVSFVSFAQQGTASPYSFYGVGDQRFKGTVENRLMAGVSVEQDSIHINVDNPSSYANLKQTTFSIGGSYSTTKLKNNTASANANRATFDYILVGLPMGKFGAGFGLVPSTSVGYKISNNNTAIEGATSTQYEGSGGLNKVFFGLGYKIVNNWSIGADVQYNFGKIETSSLESVTGIAEGTRETNTSDLSGVNFNFGTMYQAKITKKLNLYTSVNYSLSSTIKSKSQRIISVDTDPDPYIFTPNETNLDIPSKLTIGAGIGEARKWLVGASVAFAGAGNYQNHYNASSRAFYEKSTKYALGGYFIPNYSSFSSYSSRITYRAGVKYEKLGLVIDNKSINDVGVTFGAGFPISGSFSNVNLGFEIGKRGEATATLIKENYVNFTLGFSLNDRWFVKNKYK